MSAAMGYFPRDSRTSSKQPWFESLKFYCTYLGLLAETLPCVSCSIISLRLKVSPEPLGDTCSPRTDHAPLVTEGGLDTTGTLSLWPFCMGLGFNADKFRFGTDT